jgi:ArsR family transcriptional regulator
MDEFIKVFKALGEPTRLRILKILAENEMCVCEIEKVLEMTQPRISQHLKVLKHAQLVHERKEGRWSYFSVNAAKISEVFDAFKGFMKESLKTTPNFGEEYERYRRLDWDEDVLECRPKKGN